MLRNLINNCLDLTGSCVLFFCSALAPCVLLISECFFYYYYFTYNIHQFTLHNQQHDSCIVTVYVIDKL